MRMFGDEGAVGQHSGVCFPCFPVTMSCVEVASGPSKVVPGTRGATWCKDRVAGQSLQKGPAGYRGRMLSLVCPYLRVFPATAVLFLFRCGRREPLRPKPPALSWGTAPLLPRCPRLSAPNRDFLSGQGAGKQLTPSP